MGFTISKGNNSNGKLIGIMTTGSSKQTFTFKMDDDSPIQVNPTPGINKTYNSTVYRNDNGTDPVVFAGLLTSISTSSVIFTFVQGNNLVNGTYYTVNSTLDISI